MFAVDDTTQTTGSIGGKVASLTDESGAIIWSSNGTAGSVSYDIIPWIGETSSSNTTYSNAQSVFDTTYSNAGTGPGRFPFPPQSSFDTTCDGATQGACNSGNILALYNTYITNYGGTYILAPGQTSLNQYAAGLCSALSDGWYLPAICEMGYGSSECGTKLSPTLQNMQSNLVDAGNIGGLTSGGSAGLYWSSTESSGNSQNDAWLQVFASGGGFQNGGDKGNQLGVRCARALTP